MKNSVRLYIQFCFLITISIIAISCDKKVTTQNNKITITGIWGESSGEGPAVKKTVAAIKEAGYNVEYNFVPHDEYLSLINAQATAGDMSEIFAIQGGMVERFAKGGIMEDISADMDSQWKSAYDPSLLKEFSSEGKNFGIPALKIQTHVIFYNKLLLQKIGYDSFPSTWSDFITMIKAAKSAGINPIALGNKNKWVLADPVVSTLIVKMVGEDWFERFSKREARFDEPLFIAGLEKFKELVDLGAFNEDANSLDNSQQQSLFYKGNSLMFIEGSWAVSKIAENAPDEIKNNVGFAVFPAIEGGKGDAWNVTAGSGWGWAIKSGLSEEKRATALEVLRFFSKKDYGKALLETANLSPVNGVDVDPSKVDPLFVQYNKEITQNAKPVPILMVVSPSSILDIMGIGLQNIMLGQTTPKELAAELQADIEKHWNESE